MTSKERVDVCATPPTYLGQVANATAQELDMLLSYEGLPLSLFFTVKHSHSVPLQEHAAHHQNYHCGR